MTKCRFTLFRKLSILFGLLLFFDAPGALKGEASPAAVTAFHAYCKTVELRLAQQHRSPDGFVVLADSDADTERAKLRGGKLVVEELTPSPSAAFPGALLHHWRGTAFAPGAQSSDFVQMMRDVNAYPQHFAPEVLRAGVVNQHGDRMHTWMRVRQRHVITVVMDTAYDVTFGQLDVKHGYSLSESTRVDEIDSPGTKLEHVLGPEEEHGFLWRLNTYWSYEQRDGGLYLQVEAVSLTRSIPRGLAWVIRPYIESIPRESLEFTLLSASNAIRK